MRINVTSKCIKKGIRGDSVKCPVARAMTDEGAQAIWVNGNSIEFYHPNGEHLQIRTPKLVASFIKAFDKGEKVKPFSFDLKGVK